MNKDIKQTRSQVSEFKTREADDSLYIEGYFSVFNSSYELWPGATETIAPGAFADTVTLSSLFISYYN